MAWCCQATSHYLSQCSPISLSPYGITRPQWVLVLRQIPIYWFSFFCSNDSACHSYRRSYMPCHIRHAGFAQQNIRWWSGWRFIQCCPPVGGVVRLSPGSGKHFGKIFFLYIINSLSPRQNGRHFPGDICKCIFLYENIWILIKISLKVVPSDPINNIPALVQIMAWHLSDDEPWSEPMMFFLTDAYMHHSASTMLNELNKSGRKTINFHETPSAGCKVCEYLGNRSCSLYLSVLWCSEFLWKFGIFF